MKNIVTLGLFLFLSINCFGQKLSLLDLQNISNKTNWEYVNQYLINIGWEYYESEKGSSTKYNTITWSFNKSYDDKAQAWFYLYTYEGLPNKINYSVFNKPSYTTVQNSLGSNGYKLSNSEIEDNELISTYENSKFILRITTEKRERKYDESLTGYNFLLIKKSGVYDPLNGKKTDYYYDDIKKSEYTLYNGKMNGQLTVYHYNGTIKKKGTYSNGKANGTFTEYDESGNVTAKYSMKNDLKNGLLEFYENNKISYSTTYSDDNKNGEYIEYYYDDGNELFLKEYGQFLNDKKTGAWKLTVIEDGKERLITFTNYKDGLKNGLFQDVKGDSLILGNYQNNKLSGEYKIYYDLTKMVLGGIISTDLNYLKLITEGTYYDDKKSDYWKNYDLTGALRNEGRYSKDEKIGEWKYYYSKWSDNNGNQLPYSEKLYLNQSFSNGKLDGKETRYSYLNKEEYPCSNLDKNNNPLDTCKRYVYEKVHEVAFYKNDKLNGPYELKDSTNQIVDKGLFINDLKDGEWLHRYTQKDFDNNDYFMFLEGSYSSDIREGKWIQYYKKGEIAKTFHYKNGELHGKYIEWNSQNKPKEEKQFSTGKFKELIVYDSLGIKPFKKYEIYNENFSSYSCRETHYFSDCQASQEYWLSKDKDIDHNWFELTFMLATGIYSDENTGYKDGEYIFLNSNNKPIITGEYLKEDKIGLWTHFYYDQQVKIESDFKNNIQLNEKYLTLNNGLFSGEFVYENKDRNLKEVRKIKDGLRNGKTMFIDLNTGKTLEKKNYKNGISK